MDSSNATLAPIARDSSVAAKTVLLASAIACAASGGNAQDLTNSVLRQSLAPPAADVEGEYETADGRRFQLERARGRLRLRFAAQSEWIVLRSMIGPGGNEMAVSDALGLRIQFAQGAPAIFYDDDHPNGAPIARAPVSLDPEK